MGKIRWQATPASKVRYVAGVFFTLLLFALASCVDVGSGGSTSSHPPKVILIIGDGMDDHQITIARNYLVGNTGKLTLDSMPVRGAVQIVAVQEADPTRPLFVSDSANTATSIATGGVTSPSRIGTTAGTDQPLVTIMELAQQAGLGTGLVTTSSLTDATPASFVAHINDRDCHGPDQMVGFVQRGSLQLPFDCTQYLKANGGPGSIAEQLAVSGIDVMLGGGRQYFEQTAEGQPGMQVLDLARANGYAVVATPQELADAPADQRLLGVFAAENLPVRLRGYENAVATLLEQKDDGGFLLPEPFSCEPNPAYTDIPGLAEMAAVALERMDDQGGFVLMIESASIDKQSHVRRPCGSIGELQQLDETVELALAYAAQHPETLVLVTADHAHTAQLVPDPSAGELSVGMVSPGYFARVRLPDGNIMGVNYATTASTLLQQHTGAQVPLYAYGPGVKDLLAYVRQPEIFAIMAAHLGLQ